MTGIDIGIVLIVLAGLYFGSKNGAVKTLAIALTLVIGLILGSRLSLVLIKHVGASWVEPLAIAITLLFVVGSSRLGLKLGQAFENKISSPKWFYLDKYSGLILGGVTA